MKPCRPCCWWSSWWGPPREMFQRRHGTCTDMDGWLYFLWSMSRYSESLILSIWPEQKSLDLLWCFIAVCYLQNMPQTDVAYKMQSNNNPQTRAMDPLGECHPLQGYLIIPNPSRRWKLLNWSLRSPTKTAVLLTGKELCFADLARKTPETIDVWKTVCCFILRKGNKNW